MQRDTINRRSHHTRFPASKLGGKTSVINPENGAKIGSSTVAFRAREIVSRQLVNCAQDRVDRTAARVRSGTCARDENRASFAPLTPDLHTPVSAITAEPIAKSREAARAAKDEQWSISRRNFEPPDSRIIHILRIFDGKFFSDGISDFFKM